MMDRELEGANRPTELAEGRSARRVRSRWERRIQFDDLEGRRLMTASLAPVADVSIPRFLSLTTPLDGGADNQTYAVQSDNPSITASIPRGRFVTFTLNHVSSGANDPAITNETLVFQLFDELTPLTTSRITELVQSGFYSNKVIHRIAAGFPTANDFIVQGGSVNGNGTGEVQLPGFPFEDEFVPGLAFTGGGQLAMANAGRDTNSSQFFATTAQPRSLDYIHTIFGQLVGGQDVLNRLTRIPRNAGDTPTPNAVTIVSASVSNTAPDGVVLVDATRANVGDAANIRVTATSSVDGTTATRQFRATVAANSQNQRPFFTNVPENVVVGLNQTAIFQTQIHNPEVGDTITYQVNGSKSGDPGNPTFSPVQNATATVDRNGVVTVTPNQGFTGTINLIVGVRDQVDRFGAGNRNFDLKELTLTVQNGAAVNLAPIAADVTAVTATGNATQIRLAGNSANTDQGLVYSITSQPANGTLSMLDDRNGVVSYTPNAGFVGSDTFQYQVRDDGAPTPNLTSAAATVTVTVTANTGTVRLIPQVQDDDPEDTLRVLVVTPSPKKRSDRTPNFIEIFKEGDNVRTRINGVVDALVIAEDELERIVVYGSKTNDVIRVAEEVETPATLNGGGGGRNRLRSGSGNSRLHGWFGKNTLQGGPGRDALIGRDGHVKFIPSAGNDIYFLGDTNKKPERNAHQPEAPDGRFFRFNGNRLVSVHPRGPNHIGLRQNYRPGGQFLNL